MFAIIVLVFILKTGIVKLLTYDLTPSYINKGEGFTQVCTFNADPVLSRGENGDLCTVGCTVFGCNLQHRADINCSNTWIQVLISSAEEGDFGTWRCAGDDTSIDRRLSEYGMS